MTNNDVLEIWGRGVLATAIMVYEEELRKNRPTQIKLQELFGGVLDTRLEERVYYEYGPQLGLSAP